MLPPFLGPLHPRYKTPRNAVLLVDGLSALAPFFGREALFWLVDACGLAIVLAYGMIGVSFLVLRTREPEMVRPFKVPCGNLVGYAALSVSLGLALLYLPGSPSALVWPYEAAIILGWAALGATLYAWSRAAYGKKAMIDRSWT